MGMHRSEGATALLGLDGFVVGAQLEVDGEWWLSVETTADVVGCEACGTRARAHGRRAVRVRDLPMADRAVVLVWRKRIWRCPEADCEMGTWTEDTDAIAPRAVLTERARAEICRRVGRDGHTVARLAREFGVGWHTAMAAVRDHGRARVDHLSRLRLPSAMGLDETSFLAANGAHPTLLVTGFVDLDRHRLIDVVPGRSATAVSRWLSAKPSAGWPTSPPPSSIPTPATPEAWPRAFLMPASWWITSTPCGWPTKPSTRYAVASNRPPWAIGADGAIPSIAYAAGCSLPMVASVLRPTGA